MYINANDLESKIEQNRCMSGRCLGDTWKGVAWLFAIAGAIVFVGVVGYSVDDTDFEPFGIISGAFAVLGLMIGLGTSVGFCVDFCCALSKAKHALMSPPLLPQNNNYGAVAAPENGPKADPEIVPENTEEAGSVLQP